MKSACTPARRILSAPRYRDPASCARLNSVFMSGNPGSAGRDEDVFRVEAQGTRSLKLGKAARLRMKNTSTLHVSARSAQQRWRGRRRRRRAHDQRGLGIGFGGSAAQIRPPPSRRSRRRRLSRASAGQRAAPRLATDDPPHRPNPQRARRPRMAQHREPNSRSPLKASILRISPPRTAQEPQPERLHDGISRCGNALQPQQSDGLRGDPRSASAPAAASKR